MFRSIARPHFHRLLAALSVETYEGKRRVFTVGEKASRFFFVVSGRVLLLDEGADGAVVAEAGPQRAFGEFELLNDDCESSSSSRGGEGGEGLPRMFTAVTTEPTVCLTLRKAEYGRLWQGQYDGGFASSKRLLQGMPLFGPLSAQQLSLACFNMVEVAYPRLNMEVEVAPRWMNIVKTGSCRLIHKKQVPVFDPSLSTPAGARAFTRTGSGDGGAGAGAGDTTPPTLPRKAPLALALGSDVGLGGETMTPNDTTRNPATDAAAAAATAPAAAAPLEAGAEASSTTNSTSASAGGRVVKKEGENVFSALGLPVVAGTELAVITRGSSLPRPGEGQLLLSSAHTKVVRISSTALRHLCSLNPLFSAEMALAAREARTASLHVRERFSRPTPVKTNLPASHCLQHPFLAVATSSGSGSNSRSLKNGGGRLPSLASLRGAKASPSSAAGAVDGVFLTSVGLDHAPPAVAAASASAASNQQLGGGWESKAPPLGRSTTTTLRQPHPPTAPPPRNLSRFGSYTGSTSGISASPPSLSLPPPPAAPSSSTVRSGLAASINFPEKRKPAKVPAEEQISLEDFMGIYPSSQLQFHWRELHPEPVPLLCRQPRQVQRRSDSWRSAGVFGPTGGQRRVPTDQVQKQSAAAYRAMRTSARLLQEVSGKMPSGGGGGIQASPQRRGRFRAAGF